MSSDPNSNQTLRMRFVVGMLLYVGNDCSVMIVTRRAQAQKKQKEDDQQVLCGSFVCMCIFIMREQLWPPHDMS